jgi:hypothetical protein
MSGTRRVMPTSDPLHLAEAGGQRGFGCVVPWFSGGDLIAYDSCGGSLHPMVPPYLASAEGVRSVATGGGTIRPSYGGCLAPWSWRSSTGDGGGTNLAVGGDLADYEFGEAWLPVKIEPSFDHGGPWHTLRVASVLKTLLLQPSSPWEECYGRNPRFGSPRSDDGDVR